MPMPRLQYKIDILDALKKKGYRQMDIRLKLGLGSEAISSLRYGEPVSLKTLGKICDALDCEPGDLLERRKSA